MMAITRHEKAAILLRSLPRGEGEKILELLRVEHRERLRGYMDELDPALEAPAVVGEVLSEFDHYLDQADTDAAGREPAPSEEPAAHAGGYGYDLPASVTPGYRAPVAEHRPVDAWLRLQSLPVEQLVFALQDEQPRTAALILDLLPQEQAAQVLRHLPAAMRHDVSVQLALGARAERTVLQPIAQALWEICQAHFAPAASADQARARRIAEMIRRLDGHEQRDILASLAKQDYGLVVWVRQYLAATSEATDGN